MQELPDRVEDTEAVQESSIVQRMADSCCLPGLLAMAVGGASSSTAAPKPPASTADCSWAAARDATKHLAQRLSWRRVAIEGAPAVFDAIFHAFDSLVQVLVRLEEELLCLESEETMKSQVAPLLLGAAEVQRNALDWKLRILGEGGYVKVSSEISAFLELALAAGDALQARCAELREKRRRHVEALKTSIETAGAMGRPAVIA